MNSILLASKNSLRLLACLALGLALSACGNKSIDLQAPPQAPTPEAPKSSKPLPGNPANPNDPAANPEKPDQPVQNGPTRSRYRLVCDRQSKTAPFGFLDSSAKSYDGSFIFFLGAYSDRTTTITRENANIEVASGQISIPGAKGDTTDFFFIAQKSLPGFHLADSRLYVVSADTLMRTGNAVDLGPAPQLGKSIRQAADQASLTPANYGASDAGNFVLIPGSGGFKVISRDRSKTFGVIAADTSNTILPKIFEDKKVYSALVLSGGRLAVVVKKLNFTSSSVSVSSTLTSGGGSGTATPVQVYDRTSLIWSESASAAGSKSITFARLNLITGQVTRSVFTTSQPGAKIYPQFGVILENDQRTLHVGAESLTSIAPQGDSGITKAKVNYAQIETLVLNAGSVSKTDSIPYPAQAVARVEALGLKSGSTILKTLFTTENQDELIGTFDSYNGYQLYKDRGGFMDGISQNSCYHPQIVEELL